MAHSASISAESALRVLTMNSNTIPFHVHISGSSVLVDHVYMCAVCIMYVKVNVRVFVSRGPLNFDDCQPFLLEANRAYSLSLHCNCSPARMLNSSGAI